MTRSYTHRWRARILGIALLLPATVSAQTASLALSSGNASLSGTVSLNLNLTTAGNLPAGLQWTVACSPADVTSVTISPGPVLTAANKSLNCNASGGSTICLASGLNIATIGSGVAAIVTLTLAPAPGSSTVPVSIVNTVGASADGSNIPLSGSGGVIDGSGTFQLTTSGNNSGVYRNGAWVVDWDGNSQWDATDASHTFFFGAPADLPVVGDWNGDGRLKPGVFRNGAWIVDWNGNSQWDSTDAAHTFFFGAPADLPVLGDWNGDGRLKAGVFRNGGWIVDWNGNAQWDATDAAHTFFFGEPGDLPVMGDWNGDGHLKPGVFRNGTWIVDWNGNHQWDATDAAHVFFFGEPGDLPVMGDWNGDGRLKPGVFRNGSWILDWNGNLQWDSTDAAHVFSFGAPGDLPVVGHWDSSANSPGLSNAGAASLLLSSSAELRLAVEKMLREQRALLLDPELQQQISAMRRDVAEIEHRPEVQDYIRRMRLAMQQIRESRPRR